MFFIDNGCRVIKRHAFSGSVLEVRFDDAVTGETQKPALPIGRMLFPYIDEKRLL
jgi:hypothetical protein